MSDRSDAGGRSRGIDPRGPRFAAGITSVILLVGVFLGLTGLSTARGFGWYAYQPLAEATFSPWLGEWAIRSATIAERLSDPAFLVLLGADLLFLWGVVSPRTAPWSVLFRRVVRPTLKPPTEWEDPRPPRFAQGVGLVVVTIGLALHLGATPWALTIAASVAFMAAFLNAVFGLCLGCLLYLVLQRAGVIGRA